MAYCRVTDMKAVVRDLYVEWKVSDVDGAGAAENRRRDPEDCSIVADDGHCFAVFGRARIGA